MSRPVNTAVPKSAPRTYPKRGGGTRAQSTAARETRLRIGVAAGTFIVALLWRLAYLQRLSHSPLNESLASDSLIYWRWASALLRDGPIGSHPFFLGPLYPYAIGLVRLIVGSDITRVLTVQMVFGAAACAALADAAYGLTRGAVAAVVAGVIAAFYGMSVFFDGLILSESLLFDLFALLLWLVCTERWRRPAGMAAFGVIIGLMAEGRAIALVLLAPAAVLLVEPRSARAWVTGVALLAAGCVAVCAPVASRTLVVSREWIPFTYSGGLNLLIGNGAQATGSFAPVPGTEFVHATFSDGGTELDGREYLRKSRGLNLSAAASSRYWAERAWSDAQGDAGHAVARFGRKLLMLWNRLEYPQVENAREFQRVAGPLGLPLIGTFALLGTLAVAGAVVASRYGPAGRFVAWSPVALSFAIATVFVTDRYRHHLIPAAIVLAALGVDTAARAIRGRERRSMALVAAGALMGAVLVSMPIARPSRATAAAMVPADLAGRLLDRGRAQDALPLIERAVAESRRVAADSASAAERSDLATIDATYASTLRQLHRADEALPWLERSVELQPENAATTRALADAYYRAGRTAEGDTMTARLPRLVGGDGLVPTVLAWKAARESRFADAESLFTAAVQIDPQLFEAWTALVRLQAQAGNVNGAGQSLEKARRAGLEDPDLAVHEALLAAMQGRIVDAMTALRRAPGITREGDPALVDVAQRVDALIRGGSRATP
jgi:tetratricopeptide (TPR) repeat protein